MRAESSQARPEWSDDENGPVVRPYAATATLGGHHDLPEKRGYPVESGDEPVSAAELAAHLDLALGVLRVLIDAPTTASPVAEPESADRANLPDDDILKAVVNGLRAL